MGRRDPDPRPPVVILGADDPIDAPRRVEIGGGGGMGSRRKGLLAGLAVVAVLLGGLALGGGDDEPETTEGAEEERDNAGRVTLNETTTTRRRPTTTTTVPPTPVPILPGSGVQLLMTGGSGGTQLLDLDTGVASDIELSGSRDVYGLVPVQGGVIAINLGEASFVTLPTGPIVELGAADQALASGESSSVWLVTSSGGEYAGTSRARLVSIDGETLAGPIGLDYGYLLGAYSGGVIWQAGGRIYGIDLDGRVRPIAAGEALGVSEDRLLARTCDDRAICSLTLWGPGLEDPAVIQAPPEATGYYGASVVVEPRGSRAALMSYGPRGSTLSILDLDGGSFLPVDAPGEISSVAWLPDDLGLVVAQQNRVLRVHFEGDKVLVDELLDDGAAYLAVIL